MRQSGGDHGLMGPPEEPRGGGACRSRGESHFPPGVDKVVIDEIVAATQALLEVFSWEDQCAGRWE